MSITFPALHSKCPTKVFAPKISLRNDHSRYSFPIRPYSLTTKAKPLKEIPSIAYLYRSIKKFSNEYYGFTVKGANGDSSIEKKEKDEAEARGESSMPERFRYLTKEAPDKPVRWPWLIVLAVMLYSWRIVLWELSNWRKAIGAIGRFLRYASKLILAFVFRFIGDPLTYFLQLVETTIYTIRAFYSSIIAYAPIPELTLIILLTSSVLAVAEAAVPDSVNSQRHLLTLAGLFGFAVVRSYISELFFWTLLVGLFGYSRLVEKRNYVSSALPLAAALAAVGEPWIRVIVMSSYLALAILHHFNAHPSGLEEVEAVNRVPLPLICAALAIGIRVAAKWVGYRHLTWMIV